MITLETVYTTTEARIHALEQRHSLFDDHDIDLETDPDGIALNVYDLYERWDAIEDIYQGTLSTPPTLPSDDALCAMLGLSEGETEQVPYVEDIEEVEEILFQVLVEDIADVIEEIAAAFDRIEALL